jgi:hypothetical protein
MTAIDVVIDPMSAVPTEDPRGFLYADSRMGRRRLRESAYNAANHFGFTRVRRMGLESSSPGMTSEASMLIAENAKDLDVALIAGAPMEEAIPFAVKAIAAPNTKGDKYADTELPFLGPMLVIMVEPNQEAEARAFLDRAHREYVKAYPDGKSWLVNAISLDQEQSPERFGTLIGTVGNLWIWMRSKPGQRLWTSLFQTFVLDRWAVMAQPQIIYGLRPLSGFQPRGPGVPGGNVIDYSPMSWGMTAAVTVATVVGLRYLHRGRR